MEIKKENNFHELLVKAERFCAYRERCSHEVKQKMKEFDTDEKTTERIIASLQENDFLNDGRFARLFASGKFRIKRWGKNKIRAELKMKKIPDVLINKGLDAIDMSEYIKTIEHLVKKKEKEVNPPAGRAGSKKSKDKAQKIGMYLLSKGYESELVWKALKQIHA